MFLPSHVRLLSIGLYVYIAWMFLSVAAITASGALLAAIEARSEALPLFAVTPSLAYVGIAALRRLRDTLATPRLGL